MLSPINMVSVTKSLFVVSNSDQQCKFMVRQNDSGIICCFTLLNVSPQSYNTSQHNMLTNQDPGKNHGCKLSELSTFIKKS